MTTLGHIYPRTSIVNSHFLTDLKISLAFTENLDCEITTQQYPIFESQ